MKVLAVAASLPQCSFFTHRIVDPIPAPIRQTDFGAEDPPRHLGNEGFRIFGERVASDRAIPEALPSRHIYKDKDSKKSNSGFDNQKI
ncbi:unnamed protein product [Malus baccata var. baccata]